MTECVEWEGYRNAAGYGRHSAARYRGELAHRVAYCEAHGLTLDDIAGKVIRHKCDNPPCVNPDHLELGTRADNIRDRDERGRGKWHRGEDHHRSKLTAEQVLEIRAMYRPNCRARGFSALGREYGVLPQTIHSIVTGKSWGHLRKAND